MKKYLIFVLIIIVNIGFSQDTIRTKNSFQITINGAVPNDYNIKHIGKIGSEIVYDVSGYESYIKCGGAITGEFLYQIYNNLSIKTGFDLTMTSGFYTAENNKILALRSSNTYYKGNTLFSSNWYLVQTNILTGVKIQLAEKSSLYINVSFGVFNTDLKINTFFKDTNNKLYKYENTISFFNSNIFEIGYNYHVTNKVIIFSNIESRRFKRYYLGVGVKYLIN